MDLKKLDDIKINFIVGAGSSGTTLVTVLLNQYNNCIASPEMHQFIFFYKKYKNITHITQEVKDDYVNYLKRFFKQKKNVFISPLDTSYYDNLKIGDPINYSQLTKLTYLTFSGDKGKSGVLNVIVDKNPYYTFHIDKIKTVFPDAHIIALIRDYRAYILSNTQSRKLKVSKKSPEYYTYTWNLFHKYVLKGLQKYPNHIKIIKYEEIASNKMEAVKTIVEFFGLEFNVTIFDFYHELKNKIDLISPSDKNYARYQKKIKDLSSPINADRVFAWKTELEKHDIEKPDAICSSIGTLFEYYPIQKISKIKKIWVYLNSPISKLRVMAFEILKSPDLHLYYRYKVVNK